MALADILESIKKTAADEIAKLEKDFEEKLKALDDKHLENQKTVDERMHDRIEDRKKTILDKAAALGERESKNNTLKAKREIIAETLDQAVEELAGSDKYVSMLADMLKATDFAEEGTVVVPAKGKEEDTKKAIKESGKEYFLSDKSADIKGGFVIKSDKVEIDNSFETIVHSQMREDLEIQLNKSLF